RDRGNAVRALLARRGVPPGLLPQQHGAAVLPGHDHPQGDQAAAEVRGPPQVRPGAALSDPPRKVYDREYFERWYRDPRQAVILGDHVARRDALAVAAAEYVLERRVASVLDVGAGEGAWRPFLRRLRPGVRYAGVEPSAYAVAR